MTKDLITLLGLPEAGPLMIALVGAGGKTTAMTALSLEYKALNRKVLVTTTTRIYAPPEGCRDTLVLGAPGPRFQTPVPDGSVIVAAAALGKDGKLTGVSSEWLDRVYQDRLFDVILVEADGAKGKPVKAPAGYEPVIPPACTHVIGIIGMDALGQAMNDRWVHRLEEFLQVTGGASDQIIDEISLMKLIGSPMGLFKNTPDRAERILLLNKCQAAGQTEAAAAMISECLRRGIGKLTRGVWR